MLWVRGVGLVLTSRPSPRKPLLSAFGVIRHGRRNITKITRKVAGGGALVGEGGRVGARRGVGARATDRSLRMEMCGEGAGTWGECSVRPNVGGGEGGE